jgi:membrane-associated protease RseP (regulator of RpoE activity)
VFVVHPPRQRYWINALLLLATMFTTLLVGARLEYSFLHDQPAFPEGLALTKLFPLHWALEHPSRLLLGVPFAATLMLILLAHEMGHFLYCVRYGVHATLPFFIPAPTLIGTLGAFIRIKSPIRTRAALFDIGVAGPIAGFVVATITLLFSLTLSKPMPPHVPPSDVLLGYPVIFHLVHGLLAVLGIGGAAQVPLYSAYLHPTAVAAWVGMFATALNLLPGGQLDGGHLIYSLLPRAHKWVSRVAILALLPMGYWLWQGWLVWAVLLGVSGLRHPQVPEWPGVGGRRWILGLFALALLILTFMPVPIAILESANR